LHAQFLFVQQERFYFKLFVSASCRRGVEHLIEHSNLSVHSMALW